MEKLTVTVCLDCCGDTDERDSFAAYCEAQGYAVDRSYWDCTNAPAGTAGEDTERRLWEAYCNQPDPDTLTGQGRC